MPLTYARNSIAGRLIVWFTVTSFLLLVANSVLVYWCFAISMEREDDEHLADRVATIHSKLQSRPGGISAVKVEIESNALTGRFTEYLVRVFDSAGYLIAETPGMSKELSPNQFPKPTPFESLPMAGIEVESTSGLEYRIGAAIVSIADDPASPYRIQVAMNRNDEKVLMGRLRLYMGAFLALALTASAFAGWRIAQRGLKPVAQMIGTVRQIRAATLSERLDPKGLPAELSGLAANFNEMMDHLEDSFRRLGQFSSNIAHELRSPVNNMRGEVEVALRQPRTDAEYRETLASALEECSGLSQLIDGLMFLARADDPATALARERFSVADELNKIREFFDPAASEGEATIECHVTEGLELSGDRLLLQRAVANLVSNALAHIKAGGKVEIGARRQDSNIVVEVSDDGEGIAADALPHVFDRFFRADPSRNRAGGRVGLGLAIVKSIVQLYKGTVAVVSEPGRGTKVTLTLPADQPEKGLWIRG